MEEKKLTFIDLFAGAGGLSEGFIRNGFVPLAHIEMDDSACYTLKTRTAYHYLHGNNRSETYLSYLKKEISREDLYKSIPIELINSVINEEISNNNLNSLFDRIEHIKGDQSIDIIVGGPPCQAYSTLRRFSERDNPKDKRKYLYKLYQKFLEKYSPKVFVFENVPGLLSSGNGRYLEKMLKAFSDLEYSVEYQLLNAADYGVVQNRKRIIIIGSKKNLKISYPKFEPDLCPKRVEFVLSDLCALKAGGGSDITFYKTDSNEYLTSAKIRNGLTFTTQHIARPHNEQDKKIYHQAVQLWNSEKRRLKYSDLPIALQSHKNKTAFLDRFKVVAADLDASHTMVAHIAKDGHYYIHPDIAQLRSLSVREAARIQSFPDDYYFEGTRTAAFRQIGNAVPPLFAETIAKKIKEALVLWQKQ